MIHVLGWPEGNVISPILRFDHSYEIMPDMYCYTQYKSGYVLLGFTSIKHVHL